MIKEIKAKKVLTYHPNAFPTNWDLNPYRGCTIGCKYCYAQYTHKYLDLDNFFTDILIKTNIHVCLEKEFQNKNWKHEQIKIGGTTDLYQHIEKKYELLPKIYDVIKKHKNPIFIQTKSTLILRDFEIIKELSKITTVDIATSISSFDESIRKVIEPGAASAMERIEILSKFKGICRTTTLGFMPIIPLLSDTEENLETTFMLAKEFGINNIVTSFLFLRGEGKPKFMKILKSNFAEIYTDFSKLYANSTVNEEHSNRIQVKIQNLRRKYDLYGIYSPVEPIEPTKQLSLFS
ncbi:MAG: radical SAM protein [Bacteroidetes bacterium]|nr:radical SAM protein [Bacteroidota bacterium]